MTHFLTVPVNENGIIVDANIAAEVSTAATTPFAFTDVFLYSHGWWNCASSAASEYNAFSIGFAKTVGLLAGEAGCLPKWSGSSYSPLVLAVHWPSMISEDQDSVANFLEATSFFTMEHRADSVGRHAGYSLLRLLLNARADRAPLRFNLVGHSFGCRVLCSALEALAEDDESRSKAQGAELNVVLLQAAADADSLVEGQLYGRVLKSFPKLRLLVTTSQNDKALGTWYPAAQQLSHLFEKTMQAMGAVGPQGPLYTAVDKTAPVSSAVIPTFSGRFGVADLTPLHKSRQDLPGASSDFAGQHSDINLPQIYELLARFFAS